jgi:L-tryptophan---pyruvate aminotransferase
VARNMVYFVDRSTTGVCKESQMRATKILGVVSDAYEVVPPARARASGAVPRLFDFALRRLEERWRILRATVAATGAFSLPEETSGYCNFAKQTVTACPGNNELEINHRHAKVLCMSETLNPSVESGLSVAFAWLRCEKEGVEDCAELLAGHNIVGSGGEQFGGDARCVRINMLDRDNVFDMLVQRLSSIN